MRVPGWRKMTWVLVIFVAVIVVLVAINSNGVSCGSTEQSGTQQAGCGLEISEQGGTALAIGFFGFIILGIGWLVTRPSEPFPPICPNCGLPIKGGRPNCKRCGYVVPVPDEGQSEVQQIESVGESP